MGWFRETLAPPRPAESDADLLRAFVRDDSAVALSTLVERHLPMVFRVCRSVLGRGPDAEDATQAAFVVLMQRAATIRDPQALPSWLHGVALQSARSIRRKQERPLPVVANETGDALDDLSLREAREILHAELERLPDRDKLPLLLVYFEDRSHEEAARSLRLSLPAFRGRLERARKRLAARLARHRLSLTAILSVVILTVKIPSTLAATVSTALATGTASTLAMSTAAEVVPAGAKTGSTALGLGAIAAGGIMVLAALPLFGPVAAPLPVVAGSYARGHVLVLSDNQFSVLNPDEGTAVAVSPRLTTSTIKRFRADPGGRALAYETTDGALTCWRFDEPFPGVQVARNAECFAWTADGRLAVATPAELAWITVTTGARESRPRPTGRIVDIQPLQRSVLIHDGGLAILNLDDGTRTSLPGNVDANWRFSPDGTAIAADEGILNLPSGSLQPVSAPEAGRFLAWSPDAKTLLFEHRTQPGSLIVVARSGGSQTLPRRPAFGGADWCR